MSGNYKVTSSTGQNHPFIVNDTITVLPNMYVTKQGIERSYPISQLNNMYLQAKGDDGYFFELYLEPAPQYGGLKIKATKKRIQYKGRSRVVYKGPRGGEYIMVKGEYVSVKKL